MTDQEFPDTLKTVTAEGDFVERRLPTASALRKVFDDFVLNDNTAASTRGKIQGLVNGAKPWPEEKMQNSGQTHRYNYNNRRAGSIIDTRCSSDFSMLYDNEESIRTRFTPGAITDKAVAADKAHAFSVCYTDVFKNSVRTTEAAQRAIRDKNVTGLGIALFLDRYDWRPKAVMRGRVFFNPSASSDCEDFGVVCVIDTYTIQDMFDRVRNPKIAEKAGWNIDALKKALVSYYYNTDEVSENFAGDFVLAWEALERKARNYDPGIISRQHQNFPVVHGLVPERDGTVTHSIITRDNDSAAVNELLYDAEKEADDISDVVWALPYDFGDGQLAGVKGLGHQIYSLCAAELRMLMKTHDAVELASTLLVQNAGGVGPKDAELQMAGAVAVLSKRFTPLQASSFAPPLGPLFSFKESLLRTMDTVANISRPNTEDASGSAEPKSAAQVREEAGKETRYHKDLLFFTFLRWDAFHRQIVKRLLDKRCRSAAAPEKPRKEALRFFEMLAASGIDEQFIETHKNNLRIFATRTAGAGSDFTRLQSLSQMKNNTFTSMSERGRRRVDREMSAIWVGYDNLDLYYDLDGNAQPSDATGMANLENHHFAEGQPVVVGVDQNHAAHIIMHLSDMAQDMAMVKQDPTLVDPVKVFKKLQNGLPHTTRHVQLLAADPSRASQVEGYQQTMEQLVMFAQQLAPAVDELAQQPAQQINALTEALAKAQAQADRVESDKQVALRKVEAEREVELVKAQGLNATRKQKTDFQQVISTQRAIADMQRKNATSTQDLQIKMDKHFMEMRAMMEKLNVPRGGAAGE